MHQNIGKKNNMVDYLMATCDSKHKSNVNCIKAFNGSKKKLFKKHKNLKCVTLYGNEDFYMVSLLL